MSSGPLASAVNAVSPLLLLRDFMVSPGLAGDHSDRYLGAPPPSMDPDKHETRSLTKYLLIVQEAGGWDCLQALLRGFIVRSKVKRWLKISRLALRLSKRGSPVFCATECLS